MRSMPVRCVATISEIDKLNETVRSMMQNISDGSMDTLNPMKGNIEAITAVEKGAQVYHERSKTLLALLLALSLLTFFSSPSIAYSLLSILIMYIVVDFYGAVLHVVLGNRLKLKVFPKSDFVFHFYVIIYSFIDHPAFVNYPILGDGCLEFQWHHAIPQDICRKPFYEACGDLNLTALLHLGWLAVINGGKINRSYR